VTRSGVEKPDATSGGKELPDSASGDSVTATREVLSARIRALRTAQGMSIATLARLSGITSAMASQVERGVTNPSVATVTRISYALGVSVSELFEVEPPRGMVVRYADRRKISYPSIGVVDDLISSDPTGQLQVLESIIGPKQQTGGQLAPHGAAVEFVIVVNGQLELHIGDENHLLNEGDTITFDGRLAHGFTNHTDSTVHVIWVTVPATF